MNEQQIAINLREKYEEAKKAFKHVSIPVSLEDNDFNKLEFEVEKLGYKIKLAKDINIPYWQKEWKKKPLAVFYLNDNDL